MFILLTVGARGADEPPSSRKRLRGLSPAEVAADQRRRLLAALPAAFAEHGYDGPAVEELVRRSHVSRRTFYDLFEGKEEALFACHREALAAFDATVREACVGEWPQRVRSALVATLAMAAADPFRARLLAAEPCIAGPHAASFRAALLRRLAPRLRRGRRCAPIQLSPSLEECLIGGVASVVLFRIHAGRAPELPALAPDLTEFVLTPYLGRDLAREAAAG